ncbi:MFS general substrate transporter [Myriangium duriaei CBS 260.36]|uniref:Cercosporin MFS transporter CTB4 n=1 Tax=Myriangium duriaei CBS 260.36 TaxID=1168546 RepID=A0A9P4IUG8_9PEZI|nr:MFS general substrate transporter [Myriangium duriaei CBS 260.36]
MAPDIFRDTFFGHILRLATGNRVLRYPEEKDPKFAGRYYSYEKSSNMARYGQTTAPENATATEKDIEHSPSGAATPLQDQSSPATKPRHSDASLASETTQVPVERTVSNIAGTPVDAEKGRDLTVIDWDGPNDPENPKNWSTPKKFFVTFLICLLTTAVYIGSAIYSPGEQLVAKEFGVSEEVAILGLCLFVAGYGLGPMVWAPMSEVPQIGRTPIYIITLAIFVVFQLGAALPHNLGMFLAFRFLTGLFGSPVLATGGATLADIYPPKKQAYALSVWGMSAVAGPTLGPTVASFAVVAKGWRWSIWELMWLSGFALVVLFFCLPETSSTNILFRKMKRISKITGNDQLTTEALLEGEHMTGKDIAMMVLVRPITLNFQEPMVFFLNMYIALIYGLLYCWFESFPIVFMQIYKFSPGVFGLSYLGILCGALITLGPFFAYLRFVQEKQFDANGNIQPEKRLIPAMVGCFAIPICLFWFGWSAGRTHWIVPIIGSAWFSVGAFLLFNSILSYLGDAYPNYVASVYAGNDLLRSSFGTGFPLFATQMYTRLGVDWASSLLGFLSIAFIPIPFVLYKYGKTLRVNHSKFARKDI